MKTLFLIVILIALLVTSASAYDWVTNPVNGYQYTVTGNCIHWYDAENEAIALGGHLVTIRNQAENDWVYNYILSVVNPSMPMVWIGLYQPNGELNPDAEWIWSSGEPVSYTNWNTDEPNGGTRDNYGIMWRSHDGGLWNDTYFYDDYYHPFGVAEVVPVPEPSSLIALGALLTPLLFRRRQ